MRRVRLNGSSKPNLTLLDCIADQRLFAKHFKNPNSWKAWRTFIAVLFGLPLDAEQLSLFKECTGREAPQSDGYNEAWLCIGRRGGKSFILALIAVYLACFRDWRAYLGPGERGTIAIIAADRRQARVIVRYVRGLITSVPMLTSLIENERSDSIDLTNRVTLEVHSASFRTVRGYSLIAVLADELAFWSVEGAAEPDFEILNALRPGMSSIPNAMMLCASSPYARRGALWDAYRRHYGKDDPILIWQAATRVMNATIPQSVIDAALEADPASASAEYLAQFRSDIESYINREAVDGCIIKGVYERPLDPRQSYVAFVDPSGGSADAFTVAIAHKAGDKLILDLVREVVPPFSPASVVEEFAQIIKSYRLNRVVGDRYAAEWPVEAFAKFGVKYEPSPKPKSNLYRDMLPLLNSKRVQLLDHTKLINQLVGLERRVARGGRDSIDHAPNGHDDVINAAAGALVICATPKQGLVWGNMGVGVPLVRHYGDKTVVIDPNTGRLISEHRQPLKPGSHNECVPGKGVDAALSLFNARHGILPPIPPRRPK